MQDIPNIAHWDATGQDRIGFDKEQEMDERVHIGLSVEEKIAHGIASHVMRGKDRNRQAPALTANSERLARGQSLRGQR